MLLWAALVRTPGFPVDIDTSSLVKQAARLTLLFVPFDIIAIMIRLNGIEGAVKCILKCEFVRAVEGWESKNIQTVVASLSQQGVHSPPLSNVSPLLDVSLAPFPC